MAVILLQNISRTYQQGDKPLHVLSALNLEIKKGELVALVGPSGSGKTTLLQIAGLLDNPSDGRVVMNGQDMSKANDSERTLARRSHIGFVYQFHHLLPEFTALENIMLPQMIGGVRPQEAKEKAHMILADLGLSERVSHRPAKLSGGEQQRVAIARAMVGAPSLLLADEPTGNLDPETADVVFALFIKQAKERGLSALIATHNPELAKRLDRTVRLEGGQLK